MSVLASYPCPATDKGILMIECLGTRLMSVQIMVMEFSVSMFPDWGGRGMEKFFLVDL